jgi:asparagine synthase (glutamine-hydrolysing)
MCGISGIVQLDGSPVDSSALDRMIASLHHRGPDASGTHVEGSSGLAHARLSIIDLGGGAQPMSTADERLWITFNGEIFNYIELRDELRAKGHVFRTQSDTEVILAAYSEYGDDCVQHFNGQWAFAIWDTRTRRLFASRDRFGVRPFFYTTTAHSFLFASEIKALFTSPEVIRRLDPIGLDQIFTFWVTLPPRTAFESINQLAPGSSLVLEGGRLRTWKYWSISYTDPHLNGDAPRHAQDLHSLLYDAANIRLRSDVPVGAYLSGGIDSTVITSLISKVAGDRLRTFSVSFDSAEFDESAYQKQASDYFGTHHTDVHCSTDAIGRIFPDVIRHVEQPIVRTAPAPMYLLSKHVRESGYKVVLTGEGADELLGGYDIFKEEKIRRFWARNLTSAWRPLLLKRLYPYMDNIQRQSPAYLKAFFNVTEQDLSSPFFSHLPRWTTTSRVKALFSPAMRARLQTHAALDDFAASLPPLFHSWTAFNRAEYLEASSLLPGYLLSSQGDRMAMANSIEARYPFLDHRVVEFATRLPSRLKMKVLDQKHLLKEAFRGSIPETIRCRTKQPYRAPDGASFLGSSARAYVEELLAPTKINEYGVFDPALVTLLLNKFKKGRAIGVKDNMALVSIVSTQLLASQLIHNQRWFG